jgi:hypothetical protein
MEVLKEKYEQEKYLEDKAADLIEDISKSPKTDGRIKTMDFSRGTKATAFALSVFELLPPEPPSLEQICSWFEGAIMDEEKRVECDKASVEFNYVEENLAYLKGLREARRIIQDWRRTWD